MPNIETVPSSKLEEKYQSYATEIYLCRQCSVSLRFPRYNHPLKLLETRVGRCGEWTSAFTCICRSLGLDTRFIVDYNDHVWTEVYSHTFKRWIQADSSEYVYDKPLVYENKGGPPITCIIAYSYYEVKDVTYRYIKNHHSLAENRDSYFDKMLQILIQKTNQVLKARLCKEERVRISERSIKEDMDLIFTPMEPTNNKNKLSGSDQQKDSCGES